MKCPPGMILEKDECLETCKGMCGLVQNARVHWLKMSNVLISPEVGFTKSEKDQCSFVKKGKHGPVVLLLCVDDSCIFGVREDADEVTSSAGKKFTIKTEGCLKDFWVVRS